jgi:hypothetical protein
MKRVARTCAPETDAVDAMSTPTPRASGHVVASAIVLAAVAAADVFAVYSSAVAAPDPRQHFASLSDAGSVAVGFCTS